MKHAHRLPSIRKPSIPGYRLQGLLAVGGTALVYAATHESSGRAVAIKIPKPSCRSASDLERFEQEMRVARLVRHRHLVGAHDDGWLAGECPYLVMDRQPGRTLSAVLATQRRLPVTVVIEAALQLSAALTELHRQHIVHCDLHPKNIWWESPGQSLDSFTVKLLDFGLARFLTEQLAPQKILVSRSPFGFGTPGYAAPEQLTEPACVSAGSDVYSLGALLFESLCFCRPFFRNTMELEIRAQCAGSLFPLRSLAPQVPAALAEIITSMLSLEPSARPTLSEATEVLSALRKTLRNPSRPPVLRRRTSVMLRTAA